MKVLVFLGLPTASQLVNIGNDFGRGGSRYLAYTDCRCAAIFGTSRGGTGRSDCNWCLRGAEDDTHV
jgi:hypothetical protein